MTLDELKSNWRRRTTVRYLLFTYPKTSSLGFGLFLLGFGLVLKNEVDQTNATWNGIKETMHSTETTARRNNKLVIYGGSTKD